MRIAAAFFLISLTSVCTTAAQESPLEGAWKSNYDLTVAEFSSVPGITPEELAFFSDPELFGHMIQVFRPGVAIVVFEGECTQTPYEIVSQTDSHVDIMYYDESLDEKTAKRIFIEPGAFWLRVGKAREIFTRIDLDTAKAEHSCLNSLLGLPTRSD